jgi:ERCC4-type nuclease
MKKYKVLIDSREQRGWQFDQSEYCTGSVIINLASGDYSLENLQDRFSIERKGSTSEFSSNITEKRFERELDRLDKFDHSFIICEFGMNDIFSFPYNSTIPASIWKDLKVSANFIIKRLIEIETSHKVKIIMAGQHGKEYAQRIFKRMMELYD